MSEGTPPALSVGSPIPADSSHSGDEERETQTLRESALDYPVHWGRTYHRYKAGSYQYPNDERELERYDYMHHIFTRIHQARLFFAPVEEARRVLDIGTGTGIWPIDLADSGQMPRVQSITGIDLSPIQPFQGFPEKVHFEIQDASESDWGRPLRSFDYIHIRMMLGSLQDPATLLRIARRYLRPGTGWIEWQDPLPVAMSDDSSIPEHWAYSEWEKELNRASRKSGYPLHVAHRIKRWMEEEGYVDVHEHVNKLPIGRWPKDPEMKIIGHMWGEAVESGLGAVSNMVFQRGLGWSRNEVEAFLVPVRQSLKMKRVHAYHKLYCVFGRRPSEIEEEEMRKQRQAGDPAVNGV